MSLDLQQWQKEALFYRKAEKLLLEPVDHVEKAGSQKREERGAELLAKGKMGCLILAGGQGTRLKHAGPKGTFPVTNVQNKSLFQLFFEKALAASKKAKRVLPLAVMTSPLNHEETETFLRENRFFGYPAESISLFTQSMLPLLDDRGNQLKDAQGNFVEAPDGNGRALHRFYETGIYKQWKKAGIAVVNVILIDNPLADPFDAELLALHETQKNEITLKAVLRKNPEESVGVIAEHAKRLKVIEYSELPEEDKRATDGSGNLRFSLANISLLAVSMKFVEKLVGNSAWHLPLHLARKTTSVQIGSHWETVPVWKCETFIFDLLNFAKKVGVLLCERFRCFAPLKNAVGEASLERVQEALLTYDRYAYEKLSGLKAPQRLFELDPAFYYPTEEMKARWKGRTLPEEPYISASL